MNRYITTLIGIGCISMVFVACGGESGLPNTAASTAGTAVTTTTQGSSDHGSGGTSNNATSDATNSSSETGDTPVTENATELSQTNACATSENDIYVVEDGACVALAGSLSRVNLTAGCKEVILDQLDCPVDFVMGSDGYGYLSERTNNGVDWANGWKDLPSGQAQPGNIWRVQVTTKEKKLVNEIYGRRFVRPAGLALINDLSQAERDRFCGGNTIVQDLLVIADEGNTGRGTVWYWCINTDDHEESLTPMAVLSAGADRMVQPRGVAIIDRLTVVVTAQNAEGDRGLVLVKDLDSTSSAEVISDEFSTEIKDVATDFDRNVVLADAGKNHIARIALDDYSVQTIDDFTNPREILPLGLNDDQQPTYLVSEGSANQIAHVIVDPTHDPITAETAIASYGIALSGPYGLAQ